MKTSPATAQILVATDNASEARQLVTQLSKVFEHVGASTVADASVADFEAFKPDVLTLAFDTLEKAQRYYLGLYRLGSGAVQKAHRTVVLCTKDEVGAAFALCQQQYFDDYVLYWPHSYDGNRLAMSIWIACRQILDAQRSWTSPAELLLHAKHLQEVERVVVDPAVASLAHLRERIEPSLAGTRGLAATMRASKPLVLVIDDDAFAQRLVRQALDPERWEVCFADSSPEALAQLRRIAPDVILMDVRMPGQDGVALTRRLKASPDWAHIPIVMMTGDARRETLMTSMAAGAADFVVKPVGRAALEAKLDKLIPR